MTEPTSARSALNLRLVLAASGAVLCALLGVLAVRAGATFAGFALLVLAFAGAVDAVVVLRRRRARAAAHRRAGHRHDSLFE
ncbi:MAG TPA: DUF6343 family protein [Mycobacteriales bacterium]|nr:DUF6343 family protein [Mycobacteriales bacterium]